MALIIYIDVLLVVNLYINYFLVRGTSLMLRRKVSPRRVILASAVGAVGSLLILVPDLNPILCVLIKIALGIGITFAAFGRQNKIDFLISSLSFLVVSFIFGGAMTALWNIAAPACEMVLRILISRSLPLHCLQPLCMEDSAYSER